MPWAKHAVVDPETGVPQHVPVRYKRWGGFRRVGKRSPGHTSVKPRAGPFSHALEWLFPWSLGSYPGHARSVLAILPQRVTWGAIEHWKAGRRFPAAWACEALAAYITSRCEVGLALAAELRVLAEQSREAERLRRLHTAEQLSRHGRPIVLLPDD